MKLVADIEGEKLPVNVRREGVRVVAEVDGRSYELDAREFEKDAYLLLHDGRVYECSVDGGALEASGGAVQVNVGRRSYNVALTDPKRLRGAQGSAGHDGGRAEIKAPMPGKVVRVMVEAGAAVEAGDGLVVIEAMKMQNELKSPKGGTIVALHAQVGATVGAGEVLIVIE